MEYNEYISKGENVLFNIDNFTYGNRILSIHKLNLIEISVDEAKQLQTDYENKKRELENKYSTKEDDEVQVLELNDDTDIYEEINYETKLAKYKNEIIFSLISQGYIVNDVQLIIHNTDK